MYKKTKIIIVSLASLLCVGALTGGIAAIANNIDNNTVDTTKDNIDLTAIVLNKNSYNFTSFNEETTFIANLSPSNTTYKKLNWTTTCPYLYLSISSDTLTCNVTNVGEINGTAILKCSSADSKFSSFSKDISLTTSYTIPTTTYTITSHFIDLDGKKIHDDVITTVDKGTEVEGSSYGLTISGYTYQNSMPSGMITVTGNIEITHTYKVTVVAPTTYTITSHFIDLDGKKIHDDVITTVDKGTEVEGSSYGLTISGYTYQNSMPSGMITVTGNIEITHTYKVTVVAPTTYTITSHFIDLDGKKIHDDVITTVDKGTEVEGSSYGLTISGYTYQNSMPSGMITVTGNIEITHTYKVTVVAPTTYTITSHFIDLDGKKIHDDVITTVDKGTEVEGSSYGLTISGYTYQNSMPSGMITVTGNIEITHTYKGEALHYTLTIQYIDKTDNNSLYKTETYVVEEGDGEFWFDLNDFACDAKGLEFFPDTGWCQVEVKYEDGHEIEDLGNFYLDDDTTIQILFHEN